MDKTRGKVLDTRPYCGSATPPSRLKDWSRYGNDGVFNGAAAWHQLSSGLWVLYSGGYNQGYIDLGTSSDFDPNTTGALSIEYWGYILTHNDWVHHYAKGTTNDRFDTQIWDTGNWATRVKATSGQALVDAGGIETTQVWYHHVSVFDINGSSINQYINGNAGTPDTVFTFPDTSGSNFYLLSEISHLYSPNMYMGLPNIYNYALPAHQIYTNYQRDRHLFGV